MQADKNRPVPSLFVAHAYQETGEFPAPPKIPRISYGSYPQIKIIRK